MKQLLITTIFVLALLVPAFAQATTYYISPTGSNANNGLTTGTPWLTFAHALANMAGSPAGCGHTLMLMDGTYTKATHGRPHIIKSCTVNTVFLVQALNQRKAWVSGTGSDFTFVITNSAYVTFDGLRVSSADLGPVNQVNSYGPMYAADSTKLVFKNMIIHNSNRYMNSILMNWSRVSFSLVEDTEFYFFHRHAMGLDSSNNNVFRRLYCNHRFGSLPDGRQGGNPTGGDMCLTTYPASNTIMENVISEGDQSMFDIQAVALSSNNGYFGNIHLGGSIGNAGWGPVIKARFAGSAMPVNTTIRDHVVMNGNPTSAYGLYARSTRGTICDHCTFLNLALAGVLHDIDGGAPGDGNYSITITNSLAVNPGQFGFYINPNVQNHPWSVSHTNSYQASVANFTPAAHANYTNITTVDPQLGTCKLWIPAASPMKGAGIGGSDIGATILYRYQDGVLTNVPLWDPVTGEFPHGAVIAGLNDTANTSLSQREEGRDLQYGKSPLIPLFQRGK